MVAENLELQKQERLCFNSLLMSEPVWKHGCQNLFFCWKPKSFKKISCNNMWTPLKKKFSNQLVKGWELEYGVSLQKPNKRYSISKEDYIIWAQDYLKNVWILRYYFIKTFGVDPPIINGDQMQLHWNETSGQAILNFINKEVFTKENYNLLRERVTVFTQIATDGGVDLYPKIVFKGTNKRPPKLITPPNVHYQWAPKSL